MRTLYLECNMGAAGDMLTAALLELVPGRGKIIEQLNHLDLPGVSVQAVPSEKCGIRGTHMVVTVEGEEEESRDVHEHEAAGEEERSEHEDRPHGHNDGYHHHHHHHTSPAEIGRMIDAMPLENAVKEDIRAVYRLLAEAESRAHGRAVDQIHFHEVGTMDAVVDITAVCLLMHELHPDLVLASPIRTGYGEVRCAHGIMPVPAPATAFLLENIPAYAGQIEGEMCTPTGAALLKYYVKRFEERPVMTVNRTGYGMGSKDFPAANCVRAFLGETEEGKNRKEGTDRIVELRCNIDDMTGEEMGYAVQKILDAGARDVFTTPVGMKKNRPGVLLTVICSPEDREKMAEAIFRNTTTIGIRETVCSRYILNRTEETVNTEYGDVRLKKSSGYGVTRIKPEFDDVAQAGDRSGKPLIDFRNIFAAQDRK